MKRLEALVLILLSSLATAAEPPAPPAKAQRDQSVKQRLLELHVQGAKEYEIALDADKTQRCELRTQPVYVWTNPTRSGGQQGAVFVWTFQGRPEAVATIFSHPERGQRVLCHEFHSLSLATIVPTHPGPQVWQPRAGVTPRPIADAPVPADSARQRLFQLRNLARDFSATSRDEHGEAWELRLLPQPLYRYESREAKVLDGALFVYATSAGTDPEIILALEARETATGPQWHFIAARFSDLNLELKYKVDEVWSSIRGGENAFDHDPQHLFRFYRDKIIPEIDELKT